MSTHLSSFRKRDLRSRAHQRFPSNTSECWAAFALTSGTGLGVTGWEVRLLQQSACWVSADEHHHILQVELTTYSFSVSSSIWTESVSSSFNSDVEVKVHIKFSWSSWWSHQQPPDGSDRLSCASVPYRVFVWGGRGHKAAAGMMSDIRSDAQPRLISLKSPFPISCLYATSQLFDCLTSTAQPLFLSPFLFQS